MYGGLPVTLKLRLDPHTWIGVWISLSQYIHNHSASFIFASSSKNQSTIQEGSLDGLHSFSENFFSVARDQISSLEVGVMKNNF